MARCTECRKTFTPSPRAGSRQRVCGTACRLRRNRKLARRRRREDLLECREDERVRQVAHRAKVRSGRVCHAQPSDAKTSKLHKKVATLVDRSLARSRATLLRDLRGILPRESEMLADTG